VTIIDEKVFYGCYKLESIFIPSSVTNIDKQAFTGCSSLQSIEVDESNPKYKSNNGVLLTQDDF